MESFNGVGGKRREPEDPEASRPHICPCFLGGGGFSPDLFPDIPAKGFFPTNASKERAKYPLFSFELSLSEALRQRPCALTPIRS